MPIILLESPVLSVVVVVAGHSGEKADLISDPEVESKLSVEFRLWSLVLIADAVVVILKIK